MNVTTHIHSIVRGTAGFAMAISLVGCSSEVADDTSASSTEDSNASVAEVYTSLSAISNGSDVVVVGTVTGQNVVRDITETDDFTISEFKVTDVIKGDVAEGDTLEVRQIGSSGEGMDSESEALLSSDQTYLLYLVHSGLDGDLASQYYVTGANAGIYMADTAESTAFVHVADDSESDIPDEVSLTKAEEAQ
ncbi:MAG: hypothetical protein LKJ18_10215 [Ancrocorticia sp.]|nr:hypothetical protein [Ancrocorticia sp.]MCI2002228.1 hypothetical protein [Ancrocorticia sp.]